MVWFDIARNLWFSSKNTDAKPSTATEGQQLVNLEAKTLMVLHADTTWHYAGTVQLEDFNWMEDINDIHAHVMIAEDKLDDPLKYDTAVLADDVFTLDLADRRNSLWYLAIPYDIPQVETATVGVGTVTADPGGNVTVTVTSAIVTGSPLAVTVAVLKDDVTNTIASKIRAALQSTAAINTKFNVGGTNATVTLTAMTPAANDATLNIAIATGTAAGVTAVPSSANSTAGGVAAKEIVIANPPGHGEFTIEWVHTADATMTWFTTLQWLSGSALDPAAGKTYRITFYTNDGLTWQVVPTGPFPA